ncbi:MAG TPA: 6-phosphogluconolactonase [Caulobacteraceae bacterium]|jgi:6-phosphogluconolactonase
MRPIEAFPTRDDLADAAAQAVADALAGPGPRTLVAAGGSTPGPVYDRLAGRDLSWEGVTVTLTDERWVDPGSDQSNEGLIRRRLMVDKAAVARFLALKGAGATPDVDAAVADRALSGALPAAVVLLGMGDDGHVASLFPGIPELAIGLDLDGPRRVIAVARAGLEPFVPRISLTAHALVDTGAVILLISGPAKRAVIERIGADPPYAPPVATILRQDRTPVRILWAA